MSDEKLDGVLFDTRTLGFYSDEAPIYCASGRQGASRHLAGFLDLLRPGSLILELGCGSGRDAEAMTQRGFLVDVKEFFLGESSEHREENEALRSSHEEKI